MKPFSLRVSEADEVLVNSHMYMGDHGRKENINEKNGRNCTQNP